MHSIVCPQISNRRDAQDFAACSLTRVCESVHPVASTTNRVTHQHRAFTGKQHTAATLPTITADPCCSRAQSLHARKSCRSHVLTESHALVLCFSFLICLNPRHGHEHTLKELTLKELRPSLVSAKCTRRIKPVQNEAPENKKSARTTVNSGRRRRGLCVTSPRLETRTTIGFSLATTNCEEWRAAVKKSVRCRKNVQT